MVELFQDMGCGRIPGVLEVPVVIVLVLFTIIHRRAGPVHQVQIDIIGPQVLQRSVNAFLNALVPGVVQFGGKPDLASGNTRVLDALSDFRLVAICEGAE